jgi:DNA polymerase III subunit epsilon
LNVFIDIETTGREITSSRVVGLAALRDGSTPLYTLVNPSCAIPGVSTAIHGISDEDVSSSPSFDMIAAALLAYVSGCTLVGYGLLDFDIPILAEEFHRIGRSFPKFEVIDLLVAWRENEPRDLASAVKHFTKSELENAHNAMADASACQAILLEQTRRGFSFGKDDRADPAGYLTLKDGTLCFRRGKDAGKPVKSNLTYVSWLLNNAPQVTRKVLLNHLSPFPETSGVAR